MVDMKATSSEGGVSAEQLRYARVLDYGMKTGLILLIAGFTTYVSGLMPAQVPFEALPRLWTLPVGEYLGESGMPSGWAWLSLLASGDVLTVGGIALLAGVSLPCLLVLAPAYAGRRDTGYLAITLMLAGLLVLAASGALVSH
jgi:hypothetical protein